MAAPSAHVQVAQMSCCEAPVVLSPGRWPRPKPKFKAREARDDSFGLLILFLSVTPHAEPNATASPQAQIQGAQMLCCEAYCCTPQQQQHAAQRRS
jgi:hypothetical protein